MTELSSTVWKEIEAASFTVNSIGRQDGRPLIDRARSRQVIEVGKLRTILKKSRRSNDQNATLWMVYQQIIDRGGEALRGFTKDDLHEFFLINYFGSDVHELFGMKRLRPHRRSSRLTKAEFSDFLEHIVRFMAEQSVVIEMPGDIIGA